MISSSSSPSQGRDYSLNSSQRRRLLVCAVCFFSFRFRMYCYIRLRYHAFMSSCHPCLASESSLFSTPPPTNTCPSSLAINSKSQIRFLVRDRTPYSVRVLFFFLPSLSPSASFRFSQAFQQKGLIRSESDYGLRLRVDGSRLAALSLNHGSEA